MKTVFLECDPSDHSLISSRIPGAITHEGVLKDDELLRTCADAQVICCFIYSQFSRDILRKLPKLKLLCTRSVGFSHIDIAAAREQGITVCNVPDYGSHVIAEHVFALLLSSLRHIQEAQGKVQRGEFDYHGLKGMALMGKTIGIVGTGKIGTATAKIAHGFGMRILAVDQCRSLSLEQEYGVQYTELPVLLKQSDIITLHVPALPDTIHMINPSSMKQMKDGVVLVNTARGELIDSVALLLALKSGKVSRALLDVLEHERDFVWNQELISHPSVLVTPHIAFYADDSQSRMYAEAFSCIEAWKQKRPIPHPVGMDDRVCDLPGVQKKERYIIASR